jgi:hypothetical protein
VYFIHPVPDEERGSLGRMDTLKPDKPGFLPSGTDSVVVDEPPAVHKCCTGDGAGAIAALEAKVQSLESMLEGRMKELQGLLEKGVGGPRTETAVCTEEPASRVEEGSV